MSGTEWYQQMLTPPRVLQINVRYGMVPEGDHLQAMAEMVDPISQAQVAMWSSPHRRLTDLEELIAQVDERVRQWFDREVDPF